MTVSSAQKPRVVPLNRWLAAALLLFAAGLTCLAMGVYCYTRPDPGLACALLIALAPLVAWPLALGLALIGGANAGWLSRADEQEPAPTSAAESSAEESRT